MKIAKVGLRIWIALTSILAFLTGWALFSHAQKPVPLFPSTGGSSQAVDQGQLPTLAPIPSLNELTSGSSSAVQPLPSLPQVSSQQFMPRLRTMGS